MEVLLGNLEYFARSFAETLPPSPGAHAYMVGLSGELGAGKTTFVQALARALGATASPTSPTFVIAQRYAISRRPFQHLIHMDAYRLSPKDTDTFGWGGYSKDPENLIVVEWPEQLPGGVPEGMRLVEFTVTGEQSRDVVDKADI